LSQNDPYHPPQSGQYIPPPQQYGGSDIPPDSPQHYSSAPHAKRNTGILGGVLTVLAALWAYGKYALLLVFKVPALTTLVTLVISFGLYAEVYGGWFALGLVSMILVHEMGHVVEIRRQGMRASAPVFVPFLGAAIFQSSHPTDALKQAQIGIAGPLAGTLGATVAFVLFGATQNPIFLLTAWIGFYINLFNLIPVWMLDGAWIMGPTTRTFRIGASALVAVAGFFLHLQVSPLLIIIGLVGIATGVMGRGKESNPYFSSVPMAARTGIGLAWLALVLFLGVASVQALDLLNQFGR
jgi:Zn-dependent protease